MLIGGKVKNEVKKLYSVSVLGDNEDDPKGCIISNFGLVKFPVYLTTGFVEPYNSTKARRQIIVVMTMDFQIKCYNDKLLLLWQVK